MNCSLQLAGSGNANQSMNSMAMGMKIRISAQAPVKTVTDVFNDAGFHCKTTHQRIHRTAGIMMEQKQETWAQISSFLSSDSKNESLSVPKMSGFRSQIGISCFKWFLGRPPLEEHASNASAPPAALLL